MPSNPLIPGSLLQYDRPEWSPLEALIGMELSDWFMWMHAIRLDDGRDVHAYKHGATRRYFHLALDGAAFLYVMGSYRPIRSAAAIREAFTDWESLSPQPDDPAATRRALEQAIAGAKARDEQTARSRKTKQRAREDSNR